MYHTSNHRIQNRDNSINIVQLNCRRKRSVAYEIRDKAKNQNIDILAIQEPHTTNSKITGFGFQNRVIPGSDVDPWTAIVVLDPTLTIVKLTNFCNQHFTVISVSKFEKTIVIINAYFQFQDDIKIHISHLDKIVSKIRQSHSKIIICADANARSPLWFSDALNAKGRILEDFITDNDLIIENRPGNLHTYSSESAESNIDVTISTPRASILIEHWEVQDGWTTSDHRCILIVINLKPSKTFKERSWHRYNTHKADWELFQNSLNKELHQKDQSRIRNKTELIEAVDSLNKSLRKACNKAIPKKSQAIRKVPWWTPEITTAKKKAYQARRQYQRDRDETTRPLKKLEYHRANDEYKKLIADTKTEKWKKYVTIEGNKNPWGQIYKMQTGKITQQQITCSIEQENGDFTTDWKGTASALLSGIFKDDNAETENLTQKKMRNETNSPPGGKANNFTIAELKKVINKMKHKKAPGPDNFDLEIIKAALPTIENHLLAIYNGCLELGTFPEAWKTGRVVALRKGTKDETKTGSYRPICLLPILGKTLEALVLLRLNSEIDNKLKANQFGFRTGLSTEDAIVKFGEMVDESAGKYTIAIFLDIKGAFDNVWWTSVLYELKKKNCSRNIYNILKDYLNNRKVIMRTGNEQVEKIVTRGCPQGSILGPTLWNLVFDSNLTCLEDEDCETIAYADDQVLIITGNSRAELEIKGQKTVNAVQNWCTTHKMQLATEKCQMILAKTKGNALNSRASIVIKIDGKSIKRVEHFKYLGVTFSTKMKVKEHIENISQKTSQIFNNLAKVAKRDWGIGYRALNIIYKGLYIPIATYAAAGWIDRTDKKSKDKLDKSQRTALIRVTGAYRTVSGEAMPVVAGSLPITIEAQKRKLHYLLRKNLPLTVGTNEYHGPFPKESIHKIKKEIHKQSLIQWQERWDNTPKGRETYKHIPNISNRLRSYWIHPNHYTTQFLTGHGNFKEKLFSFKLINSAQCSCGEVDTLSHVLNDCYKYEHIRIELKEKLGTINRLEIKQILTKDKFQIFKELAHRILTEKETREREEEGEDGTENIEIGT